MLNSGVGILRPRQLHRKENLKIITKLILKKYKMIRSYETESPTNQMWKDKIIKISIIEKHPKKRG
jgi:hypothetical protein